MNNLELGVYVVFIVLAIVSLGLSVASVSGSDYAGTVAGYQARDIFAIFVAGALLACSANCIWLGYKTKEGMPANAFKGY